MARRIDLGTWTRVRFGATIQLNADGVAFTPDLAFGFCKGSANVYGDASVDHFVGVTSSGTWAFVIANNYDSLNVRPSKKVGVTQTNGTDLTANVVAHYSPGVAIVRGMFMVEVEKGSPNYSFRLFHRSNTTTDVTDASFLTQMVEATPVLTNHLWTAAQTLAVNEGVDGTLDAVNIFYGHSTKFLESSIVAVVKMA